MKYTAHINKDLEFEDFDQNLLLKELAKNQVSVDQVCVIEEGNLVSFQDDFNELLCIEVTGNMYYDAGCMYGRNGDAGSPPESECEMEAESVSFLGKKINVFDCLNDKAISRIEQELWECDARCDDREYEGERD